MAVYIEQFEETGALLELIAQTLGSSSGERLTLSSAYRVHTAELEPLAAGELRFMPEERWQVLAGTDHPVVAIDAVRDDGAFAVVSVNRGKLPQRFNDAVQRAEEELVDGDYALSSIEVPGLHLAIARLVDASVKSEWLIPVLPLATATGTTDIVPMQIYDPRELVALLQEDAARAVSASWE